MKLAHTRLDPSTFSPEALDRLAEFMGGIDEAPALVGREGVHIPLPNPIFHLLVDVVRDMQAGRTIILVPEDETFTTQAAAALLGVSRQFLVNLLDENKIPHHRVGTHRRVYYKDLLTYQNQRGRARRSALRKVFADLDAAGLYDQDLPPQDEG